MTSIVTTIAETRKFGPESEMDFLRHFDWYAVESTDRKTGTLYYMAILPALALAAESAQSLDHAVSLVRLSWEFQMKRLENKPEGLFMGINHPVKSFKKCGTEVCVEIDNPLADRFLSFYPEAKLLVPTS